MFRSILLFLALNITRSIGNPRTFLSHIEKTSGGFLEVAENQGKKNDDLLQTSLIPLHQETSTREIAKEQSPVRRFEEIIAKRGLKKRKEGYVELSDHHAIKCARQLRTKPNKPSHIYGEICCDPMMEQILGSMRQYPDELLGDTAKRLQRQLQRIYNKPFEVIMSAEDFVVSSYSHGTKMCKITPQGSLYILAYQNPGKYNVSDGEKELWMSTIDNQENLGSTLETQRDEWPDIAVDPLADLKSGTHCIRTKRSGNKCCNLELYQVMITVIDDVATSPVYNISSQTLGVVVNILHKKIQHRFSRVFEFFASKKDFGQSTYSAGDLFCKIKRKGLFVVGFETPKQSRYDPFDENAEDEYSSLSNPDPLGTMLDSLPGQVILRGVPLETNGYRIGFPKGSHCDHSRRDGMKCCHMNLFSSMYSMVLDLGDSFQYLNQRQIATKLRKAAEKAINEPLELLISESPLIVAGQNRSLNCTCHFMADTYHIMAWRTQGDYEIGVEMFADNGKALGHTCTRAGGRCCNEQVSFDIIKELYGLDSSNLPMISKHLTQFIQVKYNVRFEVVVSSGDFIYRPGGGRKYCKIDFLQYTVVIFETGGIPLLGEFELSDVQDTVSTALTVVGGGGPAGIIGEPNVGNIAPAESNGQAGEAENGEADSNPDNQGDANSNDENQNQDQNQSPQQAQVQAPSPPVMPMMLFQAAPAPIQNLVAAGNGEAGAGGGGAVCFSGDMLVMTPVGPKKMIDLQIGDSVLTSGEHFVYFTPIHAWLHRETEPTVNFLEFKTLSGKTLVLTPKHLVYREKCFGYPEGFGFVKPPKDGEVFAEDLTTGDCLYIYGQGKHQLTAIIGRKKVSKKGIFAPLTKNGRVFVNGILASCYSEFRNYGFLDTYVKSVSIIRRLFQRWGKSKVEVEKLPYFYDLLSDLIAFVIPEK